MNKRRVEKDTYRRSTVTEAQNLKEVVISYKGNKYPVIVQLTEKLTFWNDS